MPDSAWENAQVAVLSELIELLRRWGAWKRIEAAPGRLDALEQRVAALEYRVAASRPHPNRDFAEMGARMRTLRCEGCGFSEERAIGATG